MTILQYIFQFRWKFACYSHTYKVSPKHQWHTWECAQPSSYRIYKRPKIFNFSYGLSFSNYFYKFLSIAQTKLYFKQYSRTILTGSQNLSDLYQFQYGHQTQWEEEVYSQSWSSKLWRDGRKACSVALSLKQSWSSRMGNWIPWNKFMGFQNVNLKTGEWGTWNLALLITLADTMKMVWWLRKKFLISWLWRTKSISELWSEQGRKGLSHPEIEVGSFGCAKWRFVSVLTNWDGQKSGKLRVCQS